MAVYLHGSASISACGNSLKQPLRFCDTASAVCKTSSGLTYPYYAIPDIDGWQSLLDSTLQLVSHLLEQGGLSKRQRAKTLLFLGSTSLDIGQVEVQHGSDIWLPKIGNLAKIITAGSGLHAHSLSFNTACTASLNALIYAQHMLESGQAEHIVVLGFEARNQLTVDGFDSLALMSERRLVTFTEHASGLILGEGVGGILLSKVKPDKACFKLLGGANACDITSLSTTREDGLHIRQVIEQCLLQAGVQAEEVDLIKVHGTATANNDSAESAALRALYPDTAPPVCAFKPFTGHTLGACGVLELALLDGVSPDCSIPVPGYAESGLAPLLMPFVQGKSINDVKHVLLNHSGFGGNNAALLLERETR